MIQDCNPADKINVTFLTTFILFVILVLILSVDFLILLSLRTWQIN